ncbi:MAG: Holliday junction branch migration protein RuvA [Bacteroidota bacterium]
MIAFLEGVVHRKHPDQVILNVNGVGYDVGISHNTFEELPSVGERAQLQVYHHITDNDQRLFGFYKQAEKELFELLITVKSVGPKLGLAILSGMQADQIITSISQQDTASLSTISGIGKKTAQRMILELQDKVADFESADISPDKQYSAPALKKEAMSALESLGYNKRDAEEAVKLASGEVNEDATVTELVKASLKMMNRS